VLKNVVYQALVSAVKKYASESNLAIEENLVTLEKPKEESHGDFATTIAFALGKLYKKNPAQIAGEILNVFKNSELVQLVDIDVKGPFINFKVKDRVLIAEAQKLTTEKFDFGKGKKILLEYVSANPTGPLHVGHGRWAAIGDTLARVMREGGYDIHTEFYINDTGNQIENFLKSINAVKNNQPVPEDGYHGAYIKDLALISEDPVQYMIEHQKQILKNFKVEFTQWFSEKSLHAANLVDEAIALIKSKGLAFEKDGALWFKSTDFGDDKDRVLIRENGIKTYFAADLAYHLNKFQRGFDGLINIWGADHHGYIARVQAGLSAMTGKDKEYLKVIIGQLVMLYRNGEPVRLSKRTGEIITLEEVMEEIGTDAARYFLAMKSADNTLEFDLELAKKKGDENPVFYVQYAHARIASIFRQPEAIQIKAELKIDQISIEERTLLVHLLRFPEEIENICRHYGVQMLAGYAQALAKLFHYFYHHCRVLDINDVPRSQFRLALSQLAQEILAKTLALMGVSAPQKM
jgi:arginyl-tRNA synthetase